MPLFFINSNIDRSQTTTAKAPRTTDKTSDVSGLRQLFRRLCYGVMGGIWRGEARGIFLVPRGSARNLGSIEVR